jgi:hypothetical protein
MPSYRIELHLGFSPSRIQEINLTHDEISMAAWIKLESRVLQFGLKLYTHSK